ncbi:hypothetical protein CBOM_01566 [Ceraceosorus bombacis]|uniref:Uncharacterized protein n=1 Tax=Ceraceosorus bombacis TaxID=401625 RepID=A0A0P1BCD1_9BASI|nr:hypothetical protein CBOM_01566 [Ceraceosorus bombacis]
MFVPPSTSQVLARPETQLRNPQREGSSVLANSIPGQNDMRTPRPPQALNPHEVTSQVSSSEDELGHGVQRSRQQRAQVACSPRTDDEASKLWKHLEQRLGVNLSCAPGEGHDGSDRAAAKGGPAPKANIDDAVSAVQTAWQKTVKMDAQSSQATGASQTGTESSVRSMHSRRAPVGWISENRSQDSTLSGSRIPVPISQKRASVTSCAGGTSRIPRPPLKARPVNARHRDLSVLPTSIQSRAAPPNARARGEFGVGRPRADTETSVSLSTTSGISSDSESSQEGAKTPKDLRAASPVANKQPTCSSSPVAMTLLALRSNTIRRSVRQAIDDRDFGMEDENIDYIGVAPRLTAQRYAENNAALAELGCS